jgi:uncharacterized glyoxalase superfamily protein PhnB
LGKRLLRAVFDVGRELGYTEAWILSDREYARLQADGVAITTAIKTEPWGERFFPVTDPNGVVIQLVQWITEPDPQP